MIRFLHTSDWQLGMTRHFLSEGNQERFTQARFDAIRTMGRIAKQENCQFMLVCGDAFESNQVDRKTVARALEALREILIPVFILPGNHDPLNAASVYQSSTFKERKPTNVHVIDTTELIQVAEGVELVGAPWLSKKPLVNPIEEVLNSLEPRIGIIRICLGHGAVDLFTPGNESTGIISVAFLESIIKDGKVQFVALGDRHSLTKVGAGDQIWYSGTPESTDFVEVQSGYCQIVEIEKGMVSTKAVKVGLWQFIEMSRFDLNTKADIETLQAALDDMNNKEQTIVRLHLVGSLSLSHQAMLQTYLDSARDLFGAFEVRQDELLVVPDDTDFIDLGFSGFADSTVKQLRDMIAKGGDSGTLARDALLLMLRLSRGAA